MAEYKKTFTKPYADGFVNAPPYDTPITAEVLNGYDGAIENIEGYLSENPIEDIETENIDIDFSGFFA